MLDALAQEPTRDRARDELRRKLHALGVGARLLHFGVLAQAIASATRSLDEAAQGGRVPSQLMKELGALIDRLPQLAWEKGTTVPPPSVQEPPPPQVVAVAPIAAPWTVLVVGSEALALALEDDPTTLPCEIERTTEVGTALDLARAVAPDLVVVDTDLPGAMELVASLGDDVLTGPVPVVALADRLGAGDASKLSRLLALGVAKSLEKPVAGVTLREACGDVVGERSRALPTALHPEIGEVTVRELVDRLETELHRLLAEQLEPASRDRKVSLSTGAEVLGPYWGALARIRDVLRDRSHGAIAFRDDHLRRPIAVAPLGEPIADRRAARRGMPEVDLEGRAIVVADDDPAIVAYVGEALAAAGAVVHPAAEGDAALSLARKQDAAAVVTDVLMPGMDGIGLSRALRRDVALRDRPVVLLSWKEDLLQRLRDLRVGSSATLRKDDDTHTIVSRVREVLASRVRIEARIAGGAEVRGRLDDLTVASLLAITNAVRQDACVIVRDAAHVFEVVLEGGGIRRASRTGADGSFARGAEVLPGLLGVIGGRFLVRPVPSRGEGEPLRGELDEQLRPVLRRLRAACDAVSGVSTMELVAIGLDGDALASYLPSTPTPVRRVLERLADGASPRTMILAGDVAASVLEDVLVDAASRGLVVRATSVRGVDLLAQAEASLDVQPHAAASVRPPDRTPAAPIAASDTPEPTPLEFSLESMMPPPQPVEQPPDSKTPGSLADAVLLQVADPGESTTSRTMIDARVLRPRANRSDPPRDVYSATPTPRPPVAGAPARGETGAPARGEPLGGGVAKPDPDTMRPPLRDAMPPAKKPGE
ncbi:MAG: response regulator [Deltaproteobacteria bacterium]|nr:response regulator [Deltaproteobacteria bacterium]